MSNQSDSAPNTAIVETTERRVQYGKVDLSKAQGLRFYANHVGGNFTLFDIRLVFNDVDVIGDTVTASSTITILMSLELATLTRTVLDQAIKQYTDSFGASRLPISTTGSLEPPPSQSGG